MPVFENSTVAAISTAHGKAGISVIRMTGEDSIDIAQKVFLPRSGKKICEYRSSTAIFGDILHDGEIIDNGLCTVFFAPNSYTGENTVEISCHGSELGTALVLASLLKAGAKRAGPGEFTKRAFLNGKLDLIQAESVAELIDAESTAALKLSRAKMSGKLGREISEITEKLTNTLSSVYAYIDYPDEDLSDMSSDEMRAELTEIKDRLSSLKNSYDSGKAISSGIPCAIVGLPNSGKSTLLNLLTDSDRAIVTDIAGTTRDVITEKVTLGNITLLLSDTAGIRKTDDTVEKIGVERSYRSLDEAELVIAVFDGSTDLSEDENELMRLLSQKTEKKIIPVINKNDIADDTKSKSYSLAKYGFSDPLYISAGTGCGKTEIIKRLSILYPAGDELIKSGLVITNARMFAAITNAYEAVCDALETLSSFTQDVAGMDLERALSHLSEADGRSVTEEIVNGIFSRFCVGK